MGWRMRIKDFKFIDTALGSVNNRNNPIIAEELKGLLNGNQVDCYRTYFQYPEEFVKHVAKHGSVRGYRGPCYSKYLPIDIDSKDLVQSLQTTRDFLNHLNMNFEVDLNVIPVSFSGAKGFHIMIPSKLFDIKPADNLDKVYKSIVLELLPEGITVDTTIYDKNRLFRINNTINSKSGLYKIPLSINEIFNLTIEEIKELAKSPRNEIFWDDQFELNQNLHDVYLRVKNIEKSVSSNKNYENLLKESVREGNRNSTLTSLAGMLKAKTIPKNYVFSLLQSVNITNCNPPLSENELQNIIESIYSYKSENEFVTTTWLDLIGKEEPKIEFLIEDLLPTSCLILLVGKPKVGKSLLSLNMAISVGIGRDLWEKKTKQGPVLFISTEDGPIRLNKRIWTMLGQPGDYNPDFHFHTDDCILTNKKVSEAFRAKVIEIQPKLIVLDPLINLFRGKDLNSADNMNEVLRPLQQISKDFCCCVLVIHHARKTKGEDILDIIQGSTTISGVADGMLILRNHNSNQESKEAILDVILKDAELPKTSVIKLDDRLRWDMEGDLEEIESKTLRQEIIDLLTVESDGLFINNMEDILDVSYHKLYKELCSMREDRLVDVKPIGSNHKNKYTLKSEMQSEMQSENSSVTDQEQRLFS